MAVDNTNRDDPPSGTGAHPYPSHPPYPYLPPADDEIDLRELWNAIWRGKWIVVTVTSLFAVGAVFYALSLPNIFQAKALLAPSPEALSGSGGGGRISSQLGGIASLAGLNLPSGGGVDKVAVAIEVLKSRQFITSFIHRHDILPDLMAAEKWDWASRQLSYDNKIYDSGRQEWLRDVRPPRSPEPSDLEAYERFMAGYTVSQDRDTRFVRIAVEHISPYVAKQWVDWIVQDLNNYMKQADVKEAQRSINYLTEQLQSTALADMRRIFYQLIEEQTKTVMLAAVRDEYIFTTIDPAVVGERRVKPSRSLLVVLGTTLGGALSVVFLIVRYFLKRDSRLMQDNKQPSD